MNGLGLLFDYVLPASFIVGTGIVTLILTGGEEEYRTLSEDDEFYENNIPLETNDSELKTEKSISLEQKIDTALSLLREQSELISEKLFVSSTYEDKPPLWAKEIIDLLKQGNSISKSGESQPKYDNELIEPPAENKLLIDWLQPLWQSVIELDVQSGVEDRDIVLQNGCDLLIMYINNILQHPQNPRYRRISTNNTSFKTILGTMTRLDEFLKSVGFIKTSGSIYYDWTWFNKNDTIPISTIKTVSVYNALPSVNSEKKYAEYPEKDTTEFILKHSVELLKVRKTDLTSCKELISRTKEQQSTALNSEKDIGTSIQQSIAIDIMNNDSMK